MSENNTESVVQIDEHNLDRECIRLPSQYLKYAHQAADAKRDVAEAEAELDVVEAELAKKIRVNPEVYGIEKITEAAVKAAIETRETFKAASKKVREARYQSDLSQAVVWALETKKRTLTLLVELHGMGYFSSPKVSERGREAVEQMTQRKVRRHTD